VGGYEAVLFLLKW